MAEVWECLLLQFNLPIHSRGVLHKKSCVVSTLMYPTVKLPPPIPMPR